MKRVAVLLGGLALAGAGVTQPIITHDPDVPAGAVIEQAANKTIFDTPSGNMEDGYYYQVETGEYIAQGPEFPAAALHQQSFKSPPAGYKEAHIIAHQPEVQYVLNGQRFQKDILQRRYDSLERTPMDSMKQTYQVTPVEALMDVPAASAAVAFDASATGGPTTATSITFSHTVSGANREIEVQSYTLNDTTTGVTYNSASLTFIDNTTFPGGGRLGARRYALAAPSTGANNVVISTSGSVQIIGHSASYTGVKQTGQPEATGSNNSTSGTATCAATVATSQAWLTMAEPNGAGTCTAGASTNVRQTNANGTCFADGGPFGTGSQTLTVTHASSQWATLCGAYAPVAAASAVPIDLLF